MNPHGTVLVATDSAADAELVGRLLQPEIGDVAVTTDADQAAADFERHAPQVLILAFKSLDDALRYHGALCRNNRRAQARRHRTVVLCRKEDLWQAYRRCKAQDFDDYVLFWPMAHDAPRLPMAVLQGLRQAGADAAPAQRPDRRAIGAITHGIEDMQDEMERIVGHVGSCAGQAATTLHQARQGIDGALVDFSKQWAAQAAAPASEPARDAPMRQLFDDQTRVAVQGHLDTMASALDTTFDAIGSLQRHAETQRRATRSLASMVHQIRPLVLVVEDDPLQQRTLRAMLQSDPIDLQFCDTATKALAQIPRLRPDLVLMDIGLPDLDGLEATRRIKAIGALSAIPILMLTGQGDRHAVLESRAAGAAGLLVKPVQRELLLERIHACLGPSGGG